MMRFVIFTVVILACLNFFGVLPLSGLMASGNLGNIVTNVWASVPWPGKTAEKALIAERARSVRLDEEIVALRDELAQAKQDQAARDEALQTLQSGALHSADEIASERGRSEVLAAQFVKLQRDAASRAGEAQTRLADQQLRSDQLARDNAVLHDQLAQAAAELTALHAAQRSWEEGSRVGAQALTQERARFERLSAEKTTFQHESAAQIEALQTQLRDERQRLEVNGGGVAMTKVAQDVQNGTGIDETHQASMVEPSRFDAIKRYIMPDKEPIRVVVRYATKSEAARSHAISITQILQAKGVLIVDLSDDPQPIPANSLVYSYNDDRTNAVSIADILPEFRSNLHFAKPGKILPRPGVIQIEVAA